MVCILYFLHTKIWFHDITFLCILFVHDFIKLLTFSINGRLNPHNEAAKRGLERLEKQMKVCPSYLLLLLVLFLIYPYLYFSQLLITNIVCTAGLYVSFYLKQIHGLLQKCNFIDDERTSLSEVKICDFASVQGVDPDAPEEDEDDVEDADGDQDETELL